MSSNQFFLFSMSGDGVDDVNIPSLLISREDGVVLRSLTMTYDSVKVLLTSGTEEEIQELQKIEGSKASSHVATEANNQMKKAIHLHEQHNNYFHSYYSFNCYYYYYYSFYSA